MTKDEVRSGKWIAVVQRDKDTISPLITYLRFDPAASYSEAYQLFNNHYGPESNIILFTVEEWVHSITSVHVLKRGTGRRKIHTSKPNKEI